MSIAEQRKAVSMAQREAERDLAKAKTLGDEEWIKDALFVIEQLDATNHTLWVVSNLQSLLSLEDTK
jgi:hypothetical protein